MGEEGRQCMFCLDVAGKQGGTRVEVQSTRASSQASLAKLRVNQVKLAQKELACYIDSHYLAMGNMQALERSWPNRE